MIIVVYHITYMVLMAMTMHINSLGYNSVV